MYGLSSNTIKSIKSAIAKIQIIEKVVLYGSRAKGNYRTGSDIDITLLGADLTLVNSVYPLMDELDDLNLPYSFDISVFARIDNSGLREHIERVGKVVFSRNNKALENNEL